MTAKGFIIMGVSGCGKSTVAKLLAEKLGWDFYDADDFHPPENIKKMAGGIPLNDSDRAPWLASLNEVLGTNLKTGNHPVLACSALKRSYREELRWGNDGLKTIYLKGSYTLIWARISKRQAHYMKPNMLKSQFDTLEEPVDALVIEINLSPEEIVEKVIDTFQL